MGSNAASYAVAYAIQGPWKTIENSCLRENAHFTFNLQSTYVFPVQNKQNCFIFIADRWQPKNPIDGRYVWLPIEFNKTKPVLK